MDTGHVLVEVVFRVDLDSPRSPRGLAVQLQHMLERGKGVLPTSLRLLRRVIRVETLQLSECGSIAYGNVYGE